MNHLLSFFGSFGLALFLTWYVRGAAVANRWVSAPESYRHVHDTPIPRLGGIAIFLAFVGMTGVLVLTNRLIGVQFGFSSRNWLGLLGPAFLIFSVGLYDDIKDASPYLKFVVANWRGGMAVRQRLPGRLRAVCFSGERNLVFPSAWRRQFSGWC